MVALAGGLLVRRALAGAAGIDLGVTMRSRRTSSCGPVLRRAVCLGLIAAIVLVCATTATAAARQEVVSLRTETSKVFRNADGTYTAELHAGPVHFRNGGSWKDIDTSLVRSLPPAAWRNVAGPFAVTFAAPIGSGEIVGLSVGGRSVGFGITGGNPFSVPLAAGNKITYPGIFPGIDLEYELLNTALKETIVVDSPPSEAVSFRFPLALNGLELRPEPGGEFSLVRPDGTVEFVIPKASMTDSAVDPRSHDAAYSEAIDVSIERTDDRLVLVITPDLAWLTDPARVYPVEIDPTNVKYTTTLDTFVQTGYTSGQSGSTDLKAGTYDGGTNKARSLFKFDVSNLKGKHVQDVDFSIFENWSFSCNDRWLDLHRILDSWGTSVRWDNRPRFYGTAAASVNVAHGYEPGGCADARITFNNASLTALVANWVKGTTPNYGLGLKARSETDSYGWKRFDSVEAANNPYLLVDYNSFPKTPTNLAPAGGTTSTNKTPTLAGTYSDPDSGDAGYLKFRVCTNPTCTGTGAVVVSGPTTPTDVGSGTTSSWTVPANALAPGTPYYWQAQATDRVDVSAWTTGQLYTPICGGPSGMTATVSSPAANATIAGTATVQAAASAPAGDRVKKVEYYLDDDLFFTDTPATPSGSYSGSAVRDTKSPVVYDGAHELTVRAYNDCGDMKASAPVPVTVGNTTGTKHRATLTTTAPVRFMSYNDAQGATQTTAAVPVTVVNRAPANWAANDVVLRYRWLTPDGSAVGNPSGNTALSTALTAGNQQTVTVTVAPPKLDDGVDRAQYILRFDLFSLTDETAFGEAQGWFAAHGNPPLENPVIVNKLLKAQALGLERYYAYDSEPVGAGMEHLVNLASGNSLLRWTPFSSPGRGLSTVLGITYNSLEDHSDSPLGNNFSVSISSLTRLGLPLDIHPNNPTSCPNNSSCWIEFTDGDGTTHRFIGHDGTQKSIWWEEPAGVHLFLYQSTDPLGKWALTRPDRVTFFYDSEGFPTAVRDRNGNTLRFTLETVPGAEDPGGVKKRVKEVVDPGGRKYTLAYWAKTDTQKPQQRGKIKEIADHSGHKLTFDYYEDGNLLRITEKGGTRPDGTVILDRTFVFTYTDPDGSAPAIPLEADRVSPNAHTPSQSTRLYSVRDPRGKETIFTYCSSQSCNNTPLNRWKLQTRENREHEVTTYGYTPAMLTTTVTPPSDPDNTFRSTTYVYDTAGSITQVTNAKSEVTTLQWRSTDRHLIKMTEPGGGYAIYDYNANGYLTQQKVLVDARGAGTTDDVLAFTQLDYQNVAAAASDVSGKWKTGRTIPHWSQLSKKTSPKGTATTTPTNDYQWAFAYDTKGNLLTVTDADDGVTTYAWNTDTASPANGTLTSIVDARGPTTSDPNDYKTQFLDYDANGLATRIVDASNKTTLLSYDADGRLKSVQDARHLGATGEEREYKTVFDYDSFGRLWRQSTPKLTNPAVVGEEIIWAGTDYDENDNVVSTFASAYAPATEPTMGPATASQYDDVDRPTLVTGPDTSADPDGERTQVVYDSAGRLKSVTSPRGVFSATANDFTTEYGYDALDRVVTETRYPSSGSATGALETHYCFDAAGDLRAVTPPRGDTAFDAITNPCSPTTNFTDTDFTRRFDYDPAHRLVKETSAFTGEGATRARQTRTYAYDLDGNLITRTNELNRREDRSYNERDLLIEISEPFDAIGSRPATVVTRFVYDEVGNLKEQITPRGVDSLRLTGTAQFTTKFVYDGMNRLATVVLPKDANKPQAYVHHSYDAVGNLEWVSIPTTLTTPATVALQANEKQRTNYEYFDPGWILSSDDHVTGRVTFDYTAAGWQSSRSEPGVPTERWEYYDDGLLKTVLDRNNDAAAFEYDENNNLVLASDASGATDGKEIDTAVSYDGFDRPTMVRTHQADDANCVVSTFNYDPDSNVLERFENGSQPTDANDDCAGTITPGRRGVVEYDPADWVLRQFDYGKAGCADDQRVRNEFWPTGWEKLREISRGNSSCGWDIKQTTTWDYFPNGKLKTLETRSGPSAGSVLKEKHTVEYVTNGYYLNGNRTKDTFRLVGSTGSEPCISVDCISTFEYDARDRLLKEIKQLGAAPSVTTQYDLGVSGNIECETKGGLKTGYAYEGDQLKAQTSSCPADPVNHPETITAQYWYAGSNLDCVTTKDGGSGDCLDLTDMGDPCPATADPDLLSDNDHDVLNRLIRYCSYAGGQGRNTGTYLYDAFSRAFEQKEKRPGGTERTTSFSYLGLSNLVTSDVQKTPTGGVITTRSYTYDAFGDRISMTNTLGSASASATGPLTKPGTFTYAYDVHGSVSGLLDTNAANNTVASYGYTPYGQTDPALTSGDTGANGQPAPAEDALNPYRYSAKRLDPASGSYDMGARRFGPDTSRFLQRDLYLGALDDLSLTVDPLSGNRYALAAGNPVGYQETDGHRLAEDGAGSATKYPLGHYPTFTPVENPISNQREGRTWRNHYSYAPAQRNRLEGGAEAAAGAMEGLGCNARVRMYMRPGETCADYLARVRERADKTGNPFGWLADKVKSAGGYAADNPGHVAGGAAVVVGVGVCSLASFGTCAVVVFGGAASGGLALADSRARGDDVSTTLNKVGIAALTGEVPGLGRAAFGGLSVPQATGLGAFSAGSGNAASQLWSSGGDFSQFSTCSFAFNTLGGGISGGASNFLSQESGYALAGTLGAQAPAGMVRGFALGC